MKPGSIPGKIRNTPFVLSDTGIQQKQRVNQLAMKHLYVICIALLSLTACIRNEKSQPKQMTATEDVYAALMDSTVQYDAALAQNLGSDDYGMHRYVMAFLKRGPNRSQDSATAAQLQKAHLDNIFRMAKMGKLVLAGPFMDDGDVRGIYIFNVATVEEAQALTATDPAIQAGRLAMELHPWYGSGLLPILVPMSKRIEKTSIAR